MAEEPEPPEISTLKVLHLPPGLSDEKRVELFKNYGAVKTRTIRKSAKYTITFAEFPNKDHANQVFLRLSQLPVKGRRLSVEFAKRNVSMENFENKTEDEELSKKEAEDAEKKAHFQAFIKKLNSWAPYHLFTQPIPPYLKYKYPEPTKSTLFRIAIQMVKVPAFYTQVLHLMNRMNLPPPFEELEKDCLLVKEAYDVENYQDLLGVRVETKVVEAANEKENEVEQDEESTEESESEMESDEDTGHSMQNIIPPKRQRLQSTKKLKIPKFVNPHKQPVAPSTSTKKKKKRRPEEVFDLRHADPRNRKIVVKPVEHANKLLEPTAEEKTPSQSAIKVTQPLIKTQEHISPAVPTTSVASKNPDGFGLIFPSKKNEVEEESDKSECITTEQLHENRISTNDQRLLPVFKNYHPGKPSNRLYIKNLAKQVEEFDLHFIYRRYVLPSSKENDSDYNVRLMQEGRMKGQAFVTLPNIAQAQLALEETNGYILKDKPMVVQFAKVTKPT